MTPRRVAADLVAGTFTIVFVVVPLALLEIVSQLAEYIRRIAR